MYYLNQKIENLVRIFDQNERKSYLRLDLNENPGGLPEEFVNGVLGDVTPQLIAQYPETLHFTEVLAQYLGTDIQHLCLVNGSAEGIRYIIQAFTSENGKIVGVVPSYFMFQVYSEMYGRNFVKVPYNKAGVSLLAFEVYAFYIKSVARSFYSQLLLLWIPMRTKFPLCFLSAFFLMLFLIPFI